MTFPNIPPGIVRAMAIVGIISLLAVSAPWWKILFIVLGIIGVNLSATFARNDSSE